MLKISVVEGGSLIQCGGQMEDVYRVLALLGRSVGRVVVCVNADGAGLATALWSRGSC
jgi:hypothetical protein